MMIMIIAITYIWRSGRSKGDSGNPSAAGARGPRPLFTRRRRLLLQAPP
jgi:hypothetical protein